MSLTLAELSALRDCESLVVAYSHHIDMDEAAKVAALFTEDGVWESAEATMEGRDQIAAAFEQRQANAGRRSRHVCTNVAVTLTSADTADGLCYFTLYRADGVEGAVVFDTVPAMVGEYRDRFRRTSDGWRIAHRTATAGFIRARD